ncbi:MAG: T9SS type A sorting domain-containing protein [Paludibacteraceae bacterium]|nr:T9SS type A sorting domain-containing protein [Paludibacteraceae bacterium]
MKTRFLLLSLLATFAGSVFAQFTSVKDGNWMDPLTWSTNPESTAVPDSMTSVVVAHHVIVTGTPYQNTHCYNLTVEPGALLNNNTSAWMGSALYVKNNLINKGTISPSHDGFYVTVNGDFVNHGTISKHYIADKFYLYLGGDLTNNGSFRAVTNTQFKGSGGVAHLHKMKSLNDSTIFLGEVTVSDSLGILQVDTTVIINSPSFHLNRSRLVIPPDEGFEHRLIFDGGSILNGKIEANNNRIYTNGSTELGLGKTYNPDDHLYIRNAVLDGMFLVGGDNNVSYVVLQGNCTLEGRLRDWYSTSIWSAGDRGVRIDGSFTNNGDIISSLPDDNYGLWLYQTDGSSFVNKEDSLNIEGMKFSGQCDFSTQRDTLALKNWLGTNAITVLNLHSSVCFRKTVTVDMNGGKLILPEYGRFKTLYMWYNIIRNVDVEANFATINFNCTENNVSYKDAVFELTYFKFNTVLKGETTISGNIFPYSYTSAVVRVNGDITNRGNIADHPSAGSLTLETENNLFHYGTGWSNYETVLLGSENQNLILNESATISGRVVFNAMLTGANYQWKKNGVDIPEATNAQLVFSTGINATHFGVYQCVVDGTQQSRTILVGSEIPPAFGISNVKMKNVSPTSMLLRWKTSVAAAGEVRFATNNSGVYPLSVAEPATLVTEHAVTLTGLTEGLTYYLVVDQVDAESNEVRSVEYSFVAGDMTLGALNITAISDVPDDQGGWVFINFEADVLDAGGDITQYGVWEWMDDEWVGVGVVPATQSADYTFLAHTYRDSTETGIYWNKFYITTHTENPLVFYTCPVDSGYSVDNLVPSTPTGLQGVIAGSTRYDLEWDMNPDPDVRYYVIYRNGQKYKTSKDNYYSDNNFTSDVAEYVYEVTAVDFGGNESDKSTPLRVSTSTTANFELIKDRMLTNYPNPFKGFTNIVFTLNNTSFVELTIMTMNGKVVEKLISEEKCAGTHELTFNAAKLQSGVYMYKLRTNDNVLTNRMIVK